MELVFSGSPGKRDDLPGTRCIPQVPVKRGEASNLIRWGFMRANCVGGLLSRRGMSQSPDAKDRGFEPFGALPGGLKHSFGCTIW